MKVYLPTILCLALVLPTLGCDKEQPSDEAESGEGAEQKTADQESAETRSPDQDEELAVVEVASEGTEFDPAIEPETLPAGVWYCDMGTAHWAGFDKPESGTCPRCGMDLKQHDPDELAAQKENAVESHEHDGEAHTHGDDDHGHEGDHGHDHDDEHGHPH